MYGFETRTIVSGRRFANSPWLFPATLSSTFSGLLSPPPCVSRQTTSAAVAARRGRGAASRGLSRGAASRGRSAPHQLTRLQVFHDQAPAATPARLRRPLNRTRITGSVTAPAGSNLLTVQFKNDMLVRPMRPVPGERPAVWRGGQGGRGGRKEEEGIGVWRLGVGVTLIFPLIEIVMNCLKKNLFLASENNIHFFFL